MTGWKTIKFSEKGDVYTGFLSYTDSLPFKVRRVFWIYGWPEDVKRGGHAHKYAHQIFVVTSGWVGFSLFDGRRQEEITVSDPHRGLYVPPLTWVTMVGHAGHVGVRYCGLLCLCSEPYDEAEYIRDVAEFVKLTQGDRE